jgi:hypothetical protein
MFSVDFSQNRTGIRFKGHHKLLCCHTQETFSPDWYYLFKFSADFLNIPVVPVSTSTKFVSHRSIRRPEAAAVFVLFKSRLSFRRWSYSKACISMKKGQISEYSSGTSEYLRIVPQSQVYKNNQSGHNVACLQNETSLKL